MRYVKLAWLQPQWNLQNITDSYPHATVFWNNGINFTTFEDELGKREFLLNSQKSGLNSLKVRSQAGPVFTNQKISEFVRTPI